MPERSVFVRFRRKRFVGLSIGLHSAAAIAAARHLSKLLFCEF